MKHSITAMSLLALAAMALGAEPARTSSTTKPVGVTTEGVDQVLLHHARLGRPVSIWFEVRQGGVGPAIALGTQHHPDPLPVDVSALRVTDGHLRGDVRLTWPKAESNSPQQQTCQLDLPMGQAVIAPYKGGAGARSTPPLHWLLAGGSRRNVLLTALEVGPAFDAFPRNLHH